MGFLRAQDRLLAGGRPVRRHLDLAQHFADAHTGLGVVVHHQGAGAAQLGDGLALGHRFADLAVQRYGKLAALALLALDRDAAAHHIYDVFRDRHTQPGALDAAAGRRLLAREGVKDVLLELRGHTDAVVLDVEHIGGVAAAGAGLFGNADVDGAARRGEFYGVADDVQQDLV